MDGLMNPLIDQSTERWNRNLSI